MGRQLPTKLTKLKKPKFTILMTILRKKTHRNRKCKAMLKRKVKTMTGVLFAMMEEIPFIVVTGVLVKTKYSPIRLAKKCRKGSFRKQTKKCVLGSYLSCMLSIRKVSCFEIVRILTLKNT